MTEYITNLEVQAVRGRPLVPDNHLRQADRALQASLCRPATEKCIIHE